MKKTIYNLFIFIGFVLLLLIALFTYYVFRDFSPGDYSAGVDDYEQSDALQDITADTDLHAIPGEFIVKYKEDKINLQSSLVAPKLWLFMSRHDIRDVQSDLSSNLQLFRTEENVGELIENLENDENVEFVQPNYIYRPYVINTNDPERTKLWGLDNTGQTIEDKPSTADSDIDAPEAWAINEGTNGEIIVAVIDSGVAYNHPDLKANMWNGQNCMNENNQPLGGCMHGYDFEHNDKIPLPSSSSHGTHVAGTIAGVKNNNIGIIGVAPKAKIMALKTQLTTIEVVKSINFAKYNGAKVINASFGGFRYDSAMKQAIDSFPGLFVVAAGNDSKDHNSYSDYPCDFESPNIICVAATDHNDQLTEFSDFGTGKVDIAAPGQSIYSSISEEIIYSEYFDDVNAPDLPAGWSTGGVNPKWGTRFLDQEFKNHLITEIQAPPYTPNSNNYITSDRIDLRRNSATINFLAVCDNEYTMDETSDYIELQMSVDGINFESIPFPRVPTLKFKWNEMVLNAITGNYIGSTIAQYYFNEVPINPKFLTENMKLRFVWTTNSSDSEHLGCIIEIIDIHTYTDGSGNQYEFLQGTSMAAPHVAGLAGLVLGYKPNLTISQVKSIILESGDPITILNGKVSTGMRINAQKAMIKAGELGGVTPSNTITPTPTEGVIPSITSTTNPQITTTSTPMPFTPTPSIILSQVPSYTPGANICGKSDVNGDEIFTITDFAEFAKSYGTGSRTCADKDFDYGPCGGRDANRDGKLNIADFGGEEIGFAQRYYPKTTCAL